MIKKLVLVFAAILTFQVYAQENGVSPYSFYGIGVQKFKGTVENRSMGGLSVALDSIHVNLRNPASYTGNNLEVWNGENRPVKFAVGGSHSSVNLKSNTSEASSSSTAFDYLAINIPVGKAGVGFGLLPFTSVGYQIDNFNTDNNGDAVISSSFNGSGGVNKAFLGLGYQVTRALSLGVDFQYNFGTIESDALLFNFDDDNTPLARQSKENNRSTLSGLNLNLGLYYNTKFYKNLEVSTSLVYAPKSTLVSRNTRSLSRVLIAGARRDQQAEDLITNVDLESLNLDKVDLEIPSTLSIGLGIGQIRKWFVGAEYTVQDKSDFNNPFTTTGNATFEEASVFALGGYYIPQYNSYTSYFNRIVYRAGIRQETTGLNVNGESIDEFGMSFGLGLPLSGGASNINLGFEFGKRGTTDNNLIEENFFNLRIGLSLSDRWFQKRKYN